MLSSLPAALSLGFGSVLELGLPIVFVAKARRAASWPCSLSHAATVSMLAAILVQQSHAVASRHNYPRGKRDTASPIISYTLLHFSHFFYIAIRLFAVASDALALRCTGHAKAVTLAISPILFFAGALLSVGGSAVAAFLPVGLGVFQL